MGHPVTSNPYISDMTSPTRYSAAPIRYLTERAWSGSAGYQSFVDASLSYIVDVQRYQESGSWAMFGFCTADFWSSFAYESAEQKPKHCLTPGFLIPLKMIVLIKPVIVHCVYIVWHLVMIFCEVFFKCFTGHWADIAATEQPNW